MLEREITICNKLGLHARASAKLVQTLHGFQSSIFMVYRGKEVNAKSIMGVMMLAAGKGSKVRFLATGGDAAQMLAELEALFARKFDEV